MYQFTTYKISLQDELKDMTWVSKANGRSRCSDLAIYKRCFNPSWVVTESFYVGGKDRISQFLDVSYNEWLKEKFNKKASAQVYCYFKDIGRNESLIYFSNPPHGLDPKNFEEVALYFKSKASGWTMVYPRKS